MAVRILHGADFHLDSPFRSLTEEQARLRRREMRELLGDIADLAREEKSHALTGCSRSAPFLRSTSQWRSLYQRSFSTTRFSSDAFAALYFLSVSAARRTSAVVIVLFMGRFPFSSREA